MKVNLFKKSKKVERVKTMKVLYYRKCPIYLLMVDKQIFQWFAIIFGNLYFGYHVITPRKGQKELTENEMNQSAALTLVGATTTVDLHLGTKTPKEVKAIVKQFEGGRKKL